MSAALLFDPGNLKVLVRDCEVGSHLLQSLRGDGVNAELSLALSEAEPQLAPRRMPGPLAKQTAHLRAAIAARQGRLVRIIRRGHLALRNVTDTDMFDCDIWECSTRILRFGYGLTPCSTTKFSAVECGRKWDQADTRSLMN